jgi:glycosyltransferase involved in cell wall biosynthesis
VKLALVVPGGVGRVSADGWIPCLQWLIERLARRHEVHVFSLRGAPRPDVYPFFGATVHHAGAHPIGLRTFGAIVAEHRREPFDVLHAFWIAPPGVIAGWAGRVLGRPVLVHAAGGELVALPDIGYGGLRTWRGRLWVRLGLSGASRITAASAQMVDALRARGRAAERVPLGVDLQRWRPVPPRQRRPGAPARLIHVASLNRVKDQLTLLEAARQLAAAGVAFQLDMAGRDALGGAVQAAAQRLGLGDRVRFHGLISHAELHPLVVEGDVMWLASRHEAGPLAVLEAAVAGVPTVGTAVGHVAEWAPSAAVAVPAGDPEAFARETLALLHDEPRRQSLAREAQRRALACDADWTARRFESLYREVAGLEVPSALAPV